MTTWRAPNNKEPAGTSGERQAQRPDESLQPAAGSDATITPPGGPVKDDETPLASRVPASEIPDSKIKVRKDKTGRHKYIATLTGEGAYGWGDTPADARAKLRELKEKFERERAERKANKDDEPPLASRRTAPEDRGRWAREEVADLFTSHRNRWWHTTVGTQMHKAKVDPQGFGRVFWRAPELSR